MVGNNNFLDLFNCKDIEAYNKVEKDILSKKEATICYFKGKDAFNDVERSVRVGTNDLTFFQANSGIGYLGLSLLGNKISFDRREKAKEKIITGKSGITKLYTYFTDNPEPSEKREEITIDQRLIKKNLTPNQLEAVKIICNTPDIAIIQGPPGTGKTTTIKEALIQLNSNKENKYDFGNNLLSGFRHETVLNLTESIDLFGLPAVKIGRKSLDEDEEEIEPRILKFIDELVNTLLEKYKGLTIEDEEYIEFKKKYYAYVNFNNSIESSVAILNEVKNLNRFKYDMDVQDHLDELISKLNKKTNNTSIEVKDFLDFLYSFPLTKTAFKDEKDRIRTDLDCYKDYQELKKYAIALEKEIDNFDEKRIKVLRRELILKLRPVPSILIMKSEKDEIVDYLDSLFEMLKVERYKKFNGDKVAILDYIDSLMENPKLIKETLLDYTKVLGATNQQASSKNMALLKQDELLFDNVIIDEAATSSPLDLFIPMSLAKKRIILVGDHRQLPNITDDEIISNISKNIEVSEDSLEKIAKDMKTTLFEILMDKARLLEKKDGVKRVVTLNTQFRMHPELGNYVSNNFYKKDGGFNSPRPANEFEHNYHSLMNNYLRWIDVPFDDKEKYRLGSSRKNTPEAIKIAKHIKEALDIGNTLSIGVITIYREQVKEIKNQLIRVGVLNKNDTLTSQYANQELLIGTVDAFQGREFDIVYLSLAYVTKDIQREKNKFSRLAWANADSLLCVALSRQKRMLIVVGDINLYSSKECKDLVPSIYDLCDKCLGGGMYE